MRLLDRREQALRPFLLARDLALYALAFHAVASAQLAWGRSDLGFLLWLSAALAVALLAGRRSEELAFRIDRRARTRVRLALGLFYGLLLLFGTIAVFSSPRLWLLGRAALTLSVLQIALLVLAGLDRGNVAALVNSLMLVALAALRGGPVAAVGVTGYVGLLGFLLALDHYARRISAHPVSPARLFWPALGRAGMEVLPLVLGLALLFAAATPSRYSPVRLRPEKVETLRAEITTAYQRVILLGLVGASLVLGLARLVRRGEAERQPTVESVEVERVSDEALPERPRRSKPTYAGARGRIAQLYVAILGQAERRGLLRKPSHTPEELRKLIKEPAEPLASLTALFQLSRYGVREPEEQEVRAAELAAASMLAAFRERARRR